MKKFIILLFSFFVLSLIVAQNELALNKENKQKTGNENVKYLKAFKMKVNLSAESTNISDANSYAYIFNKGTTYIITSTISEQKKNNTPLVQLFDRNLKFIASNFDEKTKKYYPALHYRCAATGIYYMSFTCKTNEDCGEGVLKFQN